MRVLIAIALVLSLALADPNGGTKPMQNEQSQKPELRHQHQRNQDIYMQREDGNEDMMHSASWVDHLLQEPDIEYLLVRHPEVFDLVPGLLHYAKDDGYFGPAAVRIPGMLPPSGKYLDGDKPSSIGAISLSSTGMAEKDYSAENEEENLPVRSPHKPHKLSAVRSSQKSASSSDLSSGKPDLKPVMSATGEQYQQKPVVSPQQKSASDSTADA